MSKEFGLRPDRCTCFEHGFCYKSLTCRSREAKESGRFEYVRRATPTPGEKKPKKKERHIMTWRADGSHERGPVPRGRVPDAYKHLIED